jgi:hypothetical protein
MKILQTAFLLIVFAGNLQAQIGAKVQQEKIYGVWVSTESGEQMKLILNPDGTGELDEEAIRFYTQASKLVVTVEGVSTTYNFAMQGNTLTVSDGDLDEPITFTRQDASERSGAPAKNSPIAATSNNLMGTWSNYGETIIFRSGECIYLGQTYPYSVSGNNIIVQTNQGDLIMPYVVNASQLTLTVNGQNFTYNKGKANAPTSAAKPAGSGNLDPTLAGKWCYINVTSTNSGGTSTDECITINGDGTYSYYSERSMSANTPTFSAGTASQNSDSGTWWVAGDRLHYTSQSQGQGSYQLIKRNHPKTGDPMIVLDGTSYVTYFQKSPW